MKKGKAIKNEKNMEYPLGCQLEDKSSPVYQYDEELLTLRPAKEYKKYKLYSIKLPVCPYCNTVSYRIKPYIDYSISDEKDNCEIRCRKCTHTFTGKIKGISMWM